MLHACTANGNRRLLERETIYHTLTRITANGTLLPTSRPNAYELAAALPAGEEGLSMRMKLVERSISMRMAWPCASTIVSISQSPKRLPLASAGRSWMLVRLAMLVALVGRCGLARLLYFSSCGMCFASFHVMSAWTWLYMACLQTLTSSLDIHKMKRPKVFMKRFCPMVKKHYLCK